jgi:hypothetical protein
MKVSTKCPGCLTMFQKHPSDPNDYCDPCTDDSMASQTQTKHMKKRCTNHRWVWSGTPKGMVWCGNCDVDYDEKLHGCIKDLSCGPMIR